MIRISDFLKKTDKQNEDSPDIEGNKKSIPKSGKSEESNKTPLNETSQQAQPPLINLKNQDRNMMWNLLEQYKKKS